MSPTSECKHPTYYRNIAETLSDANLNQMVNLPTRVNNILDLFLTPNPTLVNHINIIPGISDHNIVDIRVNISAKIAYQKPRKISLYKKANWEGLNKSVEGYHQDMLKEDKYSKLNTESLWSNFTSKLNELVDKFIPTKKASNRNKLPWVNQQLKNLIRRRDRAFRKYKKTQNPSDRKSFLDLKHQIGLSPLSRRNTKRKSNNRI